MIWKRNSRPRRTIKKPRAKQPIIMRASSRFWRNASPCFKEDNPVPASKHPIGILGAGVMGAGIAQVAATHGFTALLLDVNENAVKSAIESIGKRLDRQVAKDLIKKKERDAAMRLIKHAKKPENLRECDLVIEAIVEDLDA